MGEWTRTTISLDFPRQRSYPSTMAEATQPPPEPHAAKLPKLDASRLPHGEANLTPLAQLKRMQMVLYARAMDPEYEKKEQAALAWERLEARKAVLKGQAANITGRVETVSKVKRHSTLRPTGPVDPPSTPPIVVEQQKPEQHT